MYESVRARSDRKSLGELLTPTFALMSLAFRADVRDFRASFGRGAFVLVSALAVLAVDLASWMFGAAGLAYFIMLFQVDLILATVLAAQLSNAIAEEKEAGTLGLLRMTRVGPLALLLGKSTSRLVQAAFLLTLQFPFMLLAVTLGGVTVMQVVAAYCALIAFMIFAGNLALLASVICATPQGANLALIAVLIGLLVVSVGGQFALNNLALAGYLSQQDALYALLSAMVTAVRQLSPIESFQAIVSVGFAGPVIGVQSVSNTLAGAVLFLVAWCALDYFVREDAPGGPMRGPRIQRRRSRWIGPLLPGRAWKHALAWKEYHFTTGGPIALIAQYVLYALIILGIYSFFGWMLPHQWSAREQLGACAMGSMLVMLATFGIFIALGLLQYELTMRTFDALLLLPISAGRLLYEKLAGCLMVMVPPATYLLIGAVLNPRLAVTMFAGPFSWFLLVDYSFFFYLILFCSIGPYQGASSVALLVFMVHAAGAFVFGVFLDEPILNRLFLVPLGVLLAGGIVVLHRWTIDRIHDREVHALQEPPRVR